MVLPSVQKMRIYLHLVPVLGVMPSLLHLYAAKSTKGTRANSHTNTRLDSTTENASENYGEPFYSIEDSIKDADALLDRLLESSAARADALEAAQIKAASRLSVVLGVSCISAIALLAAGATTQSSQIGSLRFLLASSFVGSGYFALCVALMFQVAADKSIRIPGVSQLSRRLP